MKATHANNTPTDSNIIADRTHTLEGLTFRTEITNGGWVDIWCGETFCVGTYARNDEAPLIACKVALRMATANDHTLIQKSTETDTVIFCQDIAQWVSDFTV